MKFILFILFFCSAHVCFSQIQRIDSIPKEGIVLNKGWKFQAGDHPEWARPDFDDSKWQTIDPTLDVSKIPQIRQQPIGWLRIRFHVDSSLLNKPLAYHVFQSIASQIYLNGTLIQTYGVVSADKRKIKEWRPSNDPEGIVFLKPQQTLAVRFSIQQTYLPFFIVSNYNCFIFRISTVNDAVHVSEMQHQFPYEKAVLSVFFFTICLVHFILYIKMPSQKAYLYFGIQTFLNGSNSFLSLLINFGDTSLTYINYAQPVTTAMIMLNTFFIYCAVRELFTLKRNRMYWLILILLVLSLPIGYLIKAPFDFYILIAIIVAIEPGRLVIVAYRRGNKNALILLTGYVICWMATFFDILVLVNTTAGAENKFNLSDVLWMVAVISVPLSLMIYISIDFAGTSKELGKKLAEIRQLSDEKQQILLSQNEVLEQQVTQRTSELNQSLYELKSTQAQLIQSEKMASLGELTAGIAHEIQNPLNFVNNFSEVNSELIEEMNIELDKGDIEEAKLISNDIKDNLEKINHHGKRADAIVRGMLLHSRKSSGVKEPTDLNKLIDEFIRLSYHGLRANGYSSSYYAMVPVK